MYISTHWGRAMHICVGNLTSICSDNDLSPDRRQAIIGTNAGILLIGPLGNFNEIRIGIQTYSFKNCEMASILSRPQCVNEIMHKSNALPCSVYHFFQDYCVKNFVCRCWIFILSCDLGRGGGERGGGGGCCCDASKIWTWYFIHNKCLKMT